MQGDDDAQDMIVDAEVLREAPDEMGLSTIEDRPIVVDNDLRFLGKAMAGSHFFKSAQRESQAIVKILAGREMGLGPVQAMAGIHVFDGNIVIGAGLMASVIKRSGRYTYKIVEHTHERCVIDFYDGVERLGQSSFTIEDAKAARLTGKQNWQQYPRNMLFARAMSNGARWFCPDVFGGPVYTEEEVGGEHEAREPHWESGET